MVTRVTYRRVAMPWLLELLTEELPWLLELLTEEFKIYLGYKSYHGCNSKCNVPKIEKKAKSRVRQPQTIFSALVIS